MERPEQGFAGDGAGGASFRWAFIKRARRRRMGPRECSDLRVEQSCQHPVLLGGVFRQVWPERGVQFEEVLPENQQRNAAGDSAESVVHARRGELASRRPHKKIVSGFHRQRQHIQ